MESRLILNVTVLASEPDDHVADGEPMKHGVVTPAPLTLLPDRAQVEWFLGLGKDDFIGVPHGERIGNSNGISVPAPRERPPEPPPPPASGRPARESPRRGVAAPLERPSVRRSAVPHGLDRHGRMGEGRTACWGGHRGFEGEVFS